VTCNHFLLNKDFSKSHNALIGIATYFVNLNYEVSSFSFGF